MSVSHAGLVLSLAGLVLSLAGLELEVTLVKVHSVEDCLPEMGGLSVPSVEMGENLYIGPFGELVD